MMKSSSSLGKALLEGRQAELIGRHAHGHPPVRANQVQTNCQSTADQSQINCQPTASLMPLYETGHAE
jgi:hypothetical protein